MKRVAIGARGSLLAVAQSQPILEFLEAHGFEVKIRKFTTKGDKWLSGPFEKANATSLFTKELEDSLLKGDVDLLVHSMKDVSLNRPQGIITACIPKRANPLDVAILRKDCPVKMRLGTSSIRREKLLKQLFPDAVFTWIRGNITTRIEKVREGMLRDEPFHGTFLAAAGIERLALNLSDLQMRILTLDEIPPAPGQGAILAETRSDRQDVVELLSGFHHTPTAECVLLERKVLASVGGGCQQPLGAHAFFLEDGSIRLIVKYVKDNLILKWDEVGFYAEELLNGWENYLNL